MSECPAGWEEMINLKSYFIISTVTFIRVNRTFCRRKKCLILTNLRRKLYNQVND